MGVLNATVGPAVPDEAVSPTEAMLQRGPVVQVTITVPDSVAKKIIEKGGTPPKPLTGPALIDTGASVTCIDCEAAQAMGLSAYDVVTLVSATHAAVEKAVYSAKIEISGLPLAINAPRAVGAELMTQGLLALIGRDLLSGCVLCYNGITGQFTLAM